MPWRALAVVFVAFLSFACASKPEEDPSCRLVECGEHGVCEGGACECSDGYVGMNCQYPPTCRPDCTGKNCGDNGCGGTCGTCPGEGQCLNGLCECTADCAGKECGSDGCGGSCGVCGNGTCAPSGMCCNPDCGGKNCGDDGCGGTCGSCSFDQACLAGSCGVDNGLACILRVNSCNNDGDCGGAPFVCAAPPRLSCTRPPEDCGTETTTCKNLRECWKSCTGDADCQPPRAFCVDGLCQACGEDGDCTNGQGCVNNNARQRCASSSDCDDFAADLCI